MKKPTSRATTEDRTDADPRMDIASAIALGTPLVKLAIDGKKPLEEILYRFDPADPLLFSVIDSTSTPTTHEIWLSCENIGRHGVYLDAIAVDKLQTEQPIPTATARLHEKQFGGHGQRPGAEPTGPPFYLRPTAVAGRSLIEIDVSVSRFTQQASINKGHATFIVRYTVLGVHKQNLTKTVPFVVRALSISS